MSIRVSCPRCGAEVRAPDLMCSDWRCDTHGPVLPLHLAPQATSAVLATLGSGPRCAAGAGADAGHVPLWAPWPLLPGWTVTGVGWAADDRSGTRATVLACSGPAPLGGVADLLLVAEEPGIGLGARYAGLPGPA